MTKDEIKYIFKARIPDIEDKRLKDAMETACQLLDHYRKEITKLTRKLDSESYTYETVVVNSAGIVIKQRSFNTISQAKARQRAYENSIFRYNKDQKVIIYQVSHDGKRKQIEY